MVVESKRCEMTPPPTKKKEVEADHKLWHIWFHVTNQRSGKVTRNNMRRAIKLEEQGEIFRRPSTLHCKNVDNHERSIQMVKLSNKKMKFVLHEDGEADIFFRLQNTSRS